jgi:DNA (cytosine-5)-methyltransferase 1
VTKRINRSSRAYREPTRPVGTVTELFAGVGGFRVGLSRANWKTVFSNQWEPTTKSQAASDVYVYRFGAKGHTNSDISRLLDQFEAGEVKIPRTDLLVGGFPCQDYSVAKTLSSATGLVGSKGVLWWEILRLVRLNRPKLILLENVDRLLKSPARQRGRDFAVMLASLADEGYIVEWRVVNAAEYGASQRRKRVFIVAKLAKMVKKSTLVDASSYVQKHGTLAKALPAKPKLNKSGDGISGFAEFQISGNLADISETFGRTKMGHVFGKSGVIVGRQVTTLDVIPVGGTTGRLGEVLLNHDSVDERFFVPKSQLGKWRYLKGAKKEPRTHAQSGETYHYAEGKMAFPDLPENPSRTILTGEGGSSPSRFKHVVKAGRNRFRRLTPIELERLNGFPDDWTRYTATGEVSESKRAFFMGNALVVDIVERIGKQLAKEFAATRKR